MDKHILGKKIKKLIYAITNRNFKGPHIWTFQMSLYFKH